MNKVIAAMCVLSLISAVFLGKADELSSAASASAVDAFELGMTVAAAMAFWSGLMRVAERCGIVDAVSRAVSRPLRVLMPELGSGGAMRSVSLNVTANLLGLGNAATPLGLKAMKQLEQEHCSPRTVNAFILLNTCSVQLVPMNIIALRARAGSSSPADCVLPIIVNSLAALACGIIMMNILHGGKGCSISRSQHR